MKKSSLLSLSALLALSVFLFTACPNPGDETDPETFTVTFDAGTGGTVSPATIDVPSGGTVGASNLPTPTKSDSTFGGWFTDLDDPDTEFTGTTPVTGNITVHAKWTPAGESPSKVTVTFDAAGGTPATTPVQVDVGGTVGTDNLPTVSRPSYDFEGWYTGANGGGTKFTATTVVSANITVFANWTIQGGVSKYTVTFDAGTGVTVSPPTIDVPSGGTVGASNLPAPTKDDYDFGGWFTDLDDPDTEFTGTTQVNANITVYAKWTEEEEETPEAKVTVSFNAHEGTPAPAAIKVEVNGTITELPEVGKENYVFKGWFTAATGGEKFTTTTPVTADITLHAQWVALRTVTFNAHEGTPAPEAIKVEVNGTITELPEVGKENYVFKGWFTAATGGEKFTTTTPVTADITLHAQWTEEEEDVKESGSYDLAAEEGKTVNPTGLTFVSAIKNKVTGVITITLGGEVTAGVDVTSAGFTKDTFAHEGDGKPTGKWSWATIKGILPASATENVVIKQTNQSLRFYKGHADVETNENTANNWATNPPTTALPNVYISTDNSIAYKLKKYATAAGAQDTTDGGFAFLLWDGASPKTATFKITTLPATATDYTVIVDWSGVTFK